jgi:hypothetical protein
MSTFRKISLAAVAVFAIGASSGVAQAQHHHHGGGGFGPGFVGGLALGAAVGGPYYYGGPYAYDDGPYAYAGDCYIARRVVINRWGERIVRHVRVCD